MLAALGLLLGLGLGNHLTLAILAVPAAVYLLARDPSLGRRRSGWLAGGVFLLGLGVYAYLPLRALADPPLNWGDPSTPGRFLAHVTSSSYHGYLGGRPLGEVLARVPVMAQILIRELTWPGLFLAFAGLAELMRRRPPLGRLLLVYLLLTFAFTLLYNAENSQVYLLPGVLLLTVCLGVGLASLAQARRGLWIALLLAVALPAWQLWSNASTLDLSADGEAALYARGTLGAAPPDSVLATSRDEHTFALWYAQVVEGVRPDVVVVDRRLLAADWYREQLERRRPGLMGRLAP